MQICIKPTYALHSFSPWSKTDASPSPVPVRAWAKDLGTGLGRADGAWKCRHSLFPGVGPPGFAAPGLADVLFEGPCSWLEQSALFQEGCSPAEARTEQREASLDTGRELGTEWAHPGG